MVIAVEAAEAGPLMDSLAGEGEAPFVVGELAAA
jgi:hypothetical protein